jgi:hypothetical protein
MRPYNDLANAIILTAIHDYKALLRRLKYLSKEPRFNGRRIAETDKKIDEIEEFFRSEWYDLMTNISCNDVIREIKREVEL